MILLIVMMLRNLKTVKELVSGLQLTLPDEPTEADILNVQMTNNLVNSLTSTLNLIAGEGEIHAMDPDDVDLDDDDVKDGLLEVVSDAAFMLMFHDTRNELRSS